MPKNNTANLTCNVNVKGLEKLDEFLTKHGDKVKLVGSFTLKPGDTLIFKDEVHMSAAMWNDAEQYFKAKLPDINFVILHGVDLAGVAKKEEPLDGYADVSTMDDVSAGRRVFQKVEEESCQ